MNVTEFAYLLFLQAYGQWGVNDQMLTLAEESAELTKAACRFVARPYHAKENYEALIDEVADVEIMLGQLEVIMFREGYKNFRNNVNNRKLYKLKRLYNRLENPSSTLDSVRNDFPMTFIQEEQLKELTKDG